MTWIDVSDACRMFAVLWVIAFVGIIFAISIGSDRDQDLP